MSAKRRFLFLTLVVLAPGCKNPGNEEVLFLLPRGTMVSDLRHARGNANFGFREERFVEMIVSVIEFDHWRKKLSIEPVDVQRLGIEGQELDIEGIRDLVPEDISMIFPDADWNPGAASEDYCLPNTSYKASVKYCRHSNRLFLWLRVESELAPQRFLLRVDQDRHSTG